MKNEPLKLLAAVAQSDRILLLPHCLRHSNTCKAKYNEDGLQCLHCSEDCAVNILTGVAKENGYKGICVAPGGRLAVKYVQGKRPKAVVAIACDKELEEGVEGVKGLEKDGLDPIMVIIPLVKDGCVDTVVDVQKAKRVIETKHIPAATPES
jgi:geranylgeranyl diphosphate synthase type II